MKQTSNDNLVFVRLFLHELVESLKFLRLAYVRYKKQKNQAREMMQTGTRETKL
jgi:hypothetical protein